MEKNKIQSLIINPTKDPRAFNRTRYQICHAESQESDALDSYNANGFE